MALNRYKLIDVRGYKLSKLMNLALAGGDLVQAYVECDLDLDALNEAEQKMKADRKAKMAATRAAKKAAAPKK